MILRGGFLQEKIIEPLEGGTGPAGVAPVAIHQLPAARLDLFNCRQHSGGIAGMSRLTHGVSGGVAHIAPLLQVEQFIGEYAHEGVAFLYRCIHESGGR